MARDRRESPGRAASEQWAPGPSIFEALKSHEGGAFELPDAPATPERLRFADGLLDGAGIADDEPADVTPLVEAVERLLKHPGPQMRRALYEHLVEARALITGDLLLEALNEKRWVRQGMLAPHARWLVQVAAHREPLKFGLVLLGVSGGPEDLPDVEIAARSDEFTLFAAIAAGNLLEDPRDAWWRMAKRVHGWGRVTSVAMLAPRCGDRADIRAWLVREACRCELGLELAFGCAEHGALREQLEKARVDAALIDGACHLLGLLCDPLAPRGLDEYKEALAAIRALMRHLEHRCDSLERLSFVRELHRWLEWPRPAEGEPLADPERWLAREQDGWTRAARAELAWACERLAAKSWEPEIRAAAAADDPSRRCLGWELAEWRGIDVWEAGFERLQAATTDDFLWFKLARGGDPARLERLRKLAEAVLPLDRVGQGPGEALGLAGDPVSRCLGFLLQEIKAGRFWSEKLVRGGLASPLVRNRHLALHALEHRPRADWGTAIEEAVSRALFEEPDEALRELLRRLARAR